MNAGGVSGYSAIVTTVPSPPASLAAYPGNAQITLTWSAAASATSYAVKRGLSSGNEMTRRGHHNKPDLYDTNLINGTTYYYVVTATGPTGTSANSSEASATPSATVTPGTGLDRRGQRGMGHHDRQLADNGLTAVAYANGNNVSFNDSGRQHQCRHHGRRQSRLRHVRQLPP